MQVPGAEEDFHPAAGRRLGRYELVTRIARGGMAEVWIARQRGELGFSRIVALKMIRAEYAAELAFRKMFLEEARVAARIHHANAVEVLDLGEHDRVLYLAMAYVEGDSVAGLITRLRAQDPHAKGLPVGVTTRIVGDVCAGLHAAHELTDDDGRPLDLVHRDVSPHNVLVGVDGVARLTDFGIAKALGRVTDDTETGQVKGKLSYLSPEQAKRLPPDRRSDVFAAGIVLWEMLTGERLFRGEDVADTLLNVSGKKVPDPRSLVPVPDAVALVALRALERDPADRFQTADEMRRALEAAARASSVAATADEVADLVRDHVQADLERRRAAARASSPALASAISSPAAAQSSPSGPSDPESTFREGRKLEQTSTRTSSVVPKTPVLGEPPPARSRTAWLVGGSVAVALAAAVVMSRGPSEKTAPGTAAEPAPPSSGSVRPSEPGATTPPSVRPDVVPTAAETSAATSASAARSLPSVRAVVPPRTAPDPSASAVRPKYGNPY